MFNLVESAEMPSPLAGEGDFVFRARKTKSGEGGTPAATVTPEENTR
jgi:hypothetical protein